MAELTEVTDPDDPRLADYRDLRDVELRKHLEAEHGLFLAEGEKVVRRAVEAGYSPRSFLMAPRWLDGLADVLGGTDAPCYVVSEALAEQVTGFHVHRGALASLRRRPLPSLDDVLAGARTVLVLEDIVDHTNVGAILRSGAALDIDAVLLSPRCADPLYRRSVKVAMGAVSCFFPIVLSVAAGMRRIDPVLVRVGRSFNATARQAAMKIYLPAMREPITRSLPFMACWQSWGKYSGG